MEKIPKGIRKAPKFKKQYILQKSTASTDPAPAPNVSSGDNTLESSANMDHAIDHFREETRGTGAGLWEFLASQE